MTATIDMSSYEFLDITIADHIATITFNRPDKANAINAIGHAEVGRVLRDLARADDVRVAVVTGAGTVFSVGGDFELMEGLTTGDATTRMRSMSEARELVHAHLDLDKPIIAAINGFASGAGAAFALLCDIVIAERSVQLGDGHIRAALAAGDGGAISWPLSAGMMKAKRYLLTGDFLSAEEAERIGLITEVVEPGEAYATAMALAMRLAAQPQAAVRFTKRALNQHLKVAAIQSFDYSLALEIMSAETGETAAAVARLRQPTGPG
jgi:enoyl-CoA hydratase